MDNLPEGVTSESLDLLSYDDTVAYEDQVPTNTSNDDDTGGGISLANRIGNAKVYLLSESSTTRLGKVRWQHVIGGVRE